MLQRKNITPSILRTFLVALYLPGDTSEIDTNIFISQVLGSAQDLGEVFQSLIKNGMLSYRNFRILHCIIYNFASDDIEMTSKVDEYEQELAGYDLVTKIGDYLNAEVERSEQLRQDPNLPDELVDQVKTTVTEKVLKFFSELWHLLVYREWSKSDPKLLDGLSIKVEARVTEKTLKYVNELWDSLAYQVQLPITALLFDKIAEGCLEITWLLPFHLIHFTTRQLQESTDYFREQKILRVTIAGRCIYEELPPVQVSTRKEENKGEKCNYRIFVVEFVHRWNG